MEDTAPQRAKYSITKITQKYIKIKDSEIFRHQLERLDLNQVEYLDLIEILHCMNLLKFT